MKSETKNNHILEMMILIIISLGVLLLFKSEGEVYTDYTYKCIQRDDNPEYKKYKQEEEQAYSQCIKDETAKVPSLAQKNTSGYDFEYVLDIANQKVKIERICGNRKLNNELLAKAQPPAYINERETSCNGYGKIKCIQFFGVCFFKIVTSI